jgi:hypothetical protein
MPEFKYINIYINIQHWIVEPINARIIFWDWFSNVRLSEEYFYILGGKFGKFLLRLLPYLWLMFCTK